jgi:transposase-like protein
MKTTYSEETKAAAMAALLAGQSVSSVAREYKIPKGTASNWKRQAQRQVEGVHDDGTQNTREEVGTLLLDYLAANLRALKAQTDVFADPSWIRQQEASQMAVLHGVMTDKAVRLLEAMGSAGGGDAP